MQHWNKNEGSEVHQRFYKGTHALSYSELTHKIGAMIETPRAAIKSRKIAELSEFVSFGTNDLTQMTFGYSRDDAGKFLGAYKAKNIMPDDPFASIDKEGVGVLVDMACKTATKENPSIIKGVCGEHGGDPESVEFFHNTGLDYVSCSPFRIPVAIISAAQSQLKNKR